MLYFFKRLWYTEKRGLHKLLDFQNKAMMTIVYIIAVLPVAVILKLTGNKLIDEEIERGAESYWLKPKRAKITIDSARRMS